MKTISTIEYLISIFFTGVGFYKILCYSNPSSGLSTGTSSTASTVNAYFQGDVYNYIINSQMATAYFTLAVLFAVLGSGFLIADILKNKQEIKKEA
jgi:hypothetical protein